MSVESGISNFKKWVAQEWIPIVTRRNGCLLKYRERKIFNVKSNVIAKAYWISFAYL